MMLWIHGSVASNASGFQICSDADAWWLHVSGGS